MPGYLPFFAANSFALFVFKIITAGFAFAVLWASASTATKIALRSAQPFTVSVCRFFLAAIIMLFITHVARKQALPARKYWKPLMLYGFLNISLYLGLYIIGMQFVSAGIGSMFIAVNPIFIALVSVLWLKRPLNKTVVFGLLICSAGILTAAYPLLGTSHVTPIGLLIVLGSMICYSVASIYFAQHSWAGLHILTINGWQTLFGGLFTLPFFFLFWDAHANTFDMQVVVGILWLAIPVSIGAVLLWLFLLKRNPVKASMWLFLCPIFGFGIAALVLDEPISQYTLIGVSLVLAGLYLAQQDSIQSA